MHFERESAVHKSLKNITQTLDQLEIPYAIVGGMALFFHGYRRFTEDVDLLVTSEDLDRIHAQLDGRGYLPPFEGSRNLRDTTSGVRIEFVLTGAFPGDGKPKPVAFPDPSESVETFDGMKFIGLTRLIELKLASGISNPRRARDLSDVQELIANLGLASDLGDSLDESVRQRFRELWQIVQDFPE